MAAPWVGRRLPPILPPCGWEVGRLHAGSVTFSRVGGGVRWEAGCAEWDFLEILGFEHLGGGGELLGAKA